MLAMPDTKTRKSVWEAYNGQLADMRRSGASLRQIGNITGVTRERIRQILKRHYGKIQVPFLTEKRAARIIGCGDWRFKKLREQGLLKPKHMGRRWLYDRDELEKAMLLLQRVCTHCGKPIPIVARGYKYCMKCSEDYRRNYYPFLDDDGKRAFIKANLSWRKRHPEKVREIQRKASRRFEEKRKREHYATTLYVVVSRKAILPLNSVVKAVGCENNYLILEDGLRIPVKHIRKTSESGERKGE